MRILIAALHPGYYRNLEPAVEALAARGHEVYLGSERHESALGGQNIVDRLDAIESLATLRPERGRDQAGMLGRWGLSAIRALERMPSGRNWLLDEREIDAKKRRAEEEGRAVSWT